MAWRRSGNKFGAVRTFLDGRWFASMAEADQYHTLKMRAAAGQIKDLVLQPVFAFILSGKLIFKYVADFQYLELQPDGSHILVTEDVKGKETDVFKLKEKMLKAFYPDIYVNFRKIKPARKPRRK